MKFKGPFRKDRQTEDHIFSLQRLCSIRKFKNCKTYLAFLDLSKALDRVWCDGLFYLLWKSGIQCKCWKLLRSLYSHFSNKVLLGDFESEFSDQDCGQAGVCPISIHDFCSDERFSRCAKNRNMGVELASQN